MSPTAHLMIHNVSTIGMGDHNDFEKNVEVLSSHDKSIAKAYELKTDESKEELLNLMNKETWMDADEALNEGFVDEIMFQEQAPQ
ncbi:peptidase, partial [Salmonella enterica subsp. enterica serovar Enteritidis]